MKLSEMRDLPLADFDKEVASRKKELMEMRFQGAVGQLANPARIRLIKREIAQLLTVKTQKQRQEAGQ